MTGSLTQSYFIFDSQNYKVARKIYYGIDDQVEQEDDDIQGLLGRKQEKESESESDSYESEEERKSKRSKSRVTSKKSSKSKN